MSQQLIENAFRQLMHLLYVSDADAEQRQARTLEQVQIIMDALPAQPPDDQHDIWAALYTLNVLPERRSGQDRRLASGKPRQTVVLEERRGAGRDRRQSRNVSRWIGISE